MTYTPRPGTLTEKALNLIKKTGCARSPQIAAELDIEVKQVAGILALAVNNGVLLCCKVNRPGQAPINEYRLATGGKPLPFTQLAQRAPESKTPATRRPAGNPPPPRPTAVEPEPHAPAPMPKARAARSATKPAATGDNDKLDELADLCECWKRHRTEGNTPKIIRTAIVSVIGELAGHTQAA